MIKTHLKEATPARSDKMLSQSASVTRHLYYLVCLGSMQTCGIPRDEQWSLTLSGLTRALWSAACLSTAHFITFIFCHNCMWKIPSLIMPACQSTIRDKRGRMSRALSVLRERKLMHLHIFSTLWRICPHTEYEVLCQLNVEGEYTRETDVWWRSCGQSERCHRSTFLF